jgi:hypothetical protein
MNMYKTTLTSFASASSFILVFILFNSTSVKAQSVEFLKQDAVSLSKISPKPLITLDSKEDNLNFQITQLIALEKRNDILISAIYNLATEEEVTKSETIDAIQFVQYYKQFYLYYKNIS